MSHRFVFGIALSTICLAAACSLPYTQDEPAVSERYDFRYKGDCSSWLISARTGYKYCASPTVDLPSDVGGITGFEGMDDGERDLASLKERGEVVYNQYCKSCHQADGAGNDANPPLAKSDYYGDAQNHAGIIVKGLNGPIVVLGKEYNGMMSPHGELLTDYDIAAVATYERNSWGNSDGIVLPEDVAAAR